MADKGFNIGDMLTSRRVSLNLPPYLSSGGQLSSKEVKETKTIAKLRIHVESAIRRIKEYHIYDTPIPLSLLGTVNHLWTVTCLLVNFQGPLIIKSSSSRSRSVENSLLSWATNYNRKLHCPFLGLSVWLENYLFLNWCHDDRIRWRKKRKTCFCRL